MIAIESNENSFSIERNKRFDERLFQNIPSLSLSYFKPYTCRKLIILR